jgi:hypothetical protein
VTEENTPEERAAEVLATLATLLPGREQVLEGEPLPAWMAAPWLPPLTDPAHPRFIQSVQEAEEWLESR